MNRSRLVASLVAASFLLSASVFAQEDPKKTERTWKAKCASCHGQTGKGDTEKGKQLKIEDMTTAAYQKKTDDEMKNAIANGVHLEKDGAKQDMPAFKDLTPDQINALIGLVRSFKK